MRGVLLLVLFPLSALGQTASWDSVTAYTDTLYRHSVVHLDPFILVEKERYSSREDYREFWRTRYYVNRILPYARQAITLLKATEDTLGSFDKRRQEKRYLRQTYKQLKNTYKEPLKQMYVEEGRIMVKIIERETGRPFYDLIKAYRGLDDALFWQGVAKLHGYSLKEGYDPEKEPYLEEILSAMEAPAD